MRNRSASWMLLAAALPFCESARALDINTRGLLENSHLDLTLKNVWMLNTTNAFSDQGIGSQNAWAQGIHLDYRSGLFQEWLGFDASWYGVSKLYANRSFAGRNLLRNNQGHAEGFNKVGQLYARTRFGDEKHFIETKAGWHQLARFGTLTVTRSRAAPSSWEGISTEARYQEMIARAAVVTRFSERDQPEKRHFTTLKSHKKIPYIATGDLTWQPEKGRAITLVAGESKDYLLRQGVETAWFLPLDEQYKLMLRSVYYHNKGLSNWEGARGFDHSARHFSALAAIATEQVEAGMAWATTRARQRNNLGHFYWHFGKNTRGAFNSKADGPGNDYVNDGEQMLHVYGQYQLTPELLAGLFGYYGSHMRYQNVPLRQWEYGGYASWAPESLAGLSIFAAFGPSHSWKISKGKPVLHGDKRGFQHARGIGAEITVQYKHRLF